MFSDIKITECESLSFSSQSVDDSSQVLGDFCLKCVEADEGDGGAVLFSGLRKVNGEFGEPIVSFFWID